MATTITTVCPNCDGTLILPMAAAGKRVKCKHCGGAVPVPGVAAEVKPAAKPAAPKPVVKAAPPPPPPPSEDANAPLKFKDDDDENENPYGVVAESDVPRCPHCANELDPPDTKICLNCGYDLLTRQRHKSKKVYETTTQDKLQYRMPAFIWIGVLILLIIVTASFWMNMESWMIGGMLDNEKPNEATGRPTFIIGPNCFNVFMTVFVAFMMWMGIRVIVDKLIIHPNPAEIEKLVDDEDDDQDDEDEDEDDEDEDEDEEEDEPPPKKKRR